MENMRMFFVRYLIFNMYEKLDELNKTDVKFDRIGMLNDLINLSVQLKSAFEQQKESERELPYPENLKKIFKEDWD